MATIKDYDIANNELNQVNESGTGSRPYSPTNGVTKPVSTITNSYDEDSKSTYDLQKDQAGALLIFSFENESSTAYKDNVDISKALYDLGFKSAATANIANGYGGGVPYNAVYGVKSGNVRYRRGTDWRSGDWDNVTDVVTVVS